ncbi:MAG: HD domain-containing protein [Phycisphaerae bacterium]|nr:HD domain-containing protein [Phycisphaerae bacterium]
MPRNSTDHSEAPPRKFVAELGPSEFVRGLFSISNAQLGRTRNDKPYLRCLLGDKTGDMPGRMWSVDPESFRRLATDGFVYLEGETQAYQGEMQLIIQSIEPVEPTIEQLRELLPCSSREPAEMFAEVTGVLETLRHPWMKALARVYLDDAPLMKAFREAPAAKSMHHAYLGGLLEHTLSLLILGDRVCAHYPKINRDIVLMGLFLHDLAKTRELVYDRTFGYTDRGELIGHIVDGAIMLHDRAQLVMRSTGLRPPMHAVTVLQHIIISHHGQAEYGAAKLPATPEAIMVAMLDNLDAKMAIALSAARPDRSATFDLGGNFTDRLWALENTKLFRPDPLAE